MLQLTRRSAALRQVFMTLAVLALALKVLVPAGFMAAPKTNGLPFAVVLCTGEGPMVVEPGGALHKAGKPGEAPGEKSAHDAPCAFAGHGAGALATGLLASEPAGYAAWRAEPAARPTDLAPGRGLAAPPPPTRGPPILSA